MPVLALKEVYPMPALALVSRRMPALGPEKVAKCLHWLLRKSLNASICS